MRTFAAITDTERALLVAGIAAIATIGVGVLAAAAAYFTNQRDRRRVLYSEAIKAAVAWKELLYRVRRRADSAEATRAIVELFHQAQEHLTYYQAWVGSDSKYMARSYRRLVKRVKGKLEPLIRQAWESQSRDAPGNALPGDDHPDLDPWTEDFLSDVRSHLSWKPWRKLAVIKRNGRDGDPPEG